jgi:thioredoxin-like negative regulator of GroEL
MFLTPDDFFTNNNELCVNVKGYSFVFFMTKTCRFCDDVKGPFNQLSQQIEGCKFAYMDVDQKQQQVVSMSYQTMSPISYVPLLVLFLNGRRVSQFFPDEENPSNNLKKMANFIVAACRHPSSSATPTTSAPKQQNNIPPYSIGIPGNLASKRVCYLGYENAYGH